MVSVLDKSKYACGLAGVWNFDWLCRGSVDIEIGGGKSELLCAKERGSGDTPVPLSRIADDVRSVKTGMEIELPGSGPSMDVG